MNAANAMTWAKIAALRAPMGDRCVTSTTLVIASKNAPHTEASNNTSLLAIPASNARRASAMPSIEKGRAAIATAKACNNTARCCSAVVAGPPLPPPLTPPLTPPLPPEMQGRSRKNWWKVCQKAHWWASATAVATISKSLLVTDPLQWVVPSNGRKGRNKLRF
jgi:hypothetical protein